MCTGAELLPLIISGGLSVAGQAISSRGAQEQAAAQAAARNRVLKETLLKNDPLAERARAVFTDRLAEVQPEQSEQEQADLTAERVGTLESAIEAPRPEDIPLSGSAPKLVQSEIAKRMLDAFGAAKQKAQSLGTLGGFGDTFFQQGLANSQAGNEISLPNNFIRGNLALLPALQDFAQVAATKPISPIGGILSAAGNTLGTYAGGQGYFGGGAPAAPLPEVGLGRLY